VADASRALAATVSVGDQINLVGNIKIRLSVLQRDFGDVVTGQPQRAPQPGGPAP
jgi:hypothetical protein